MTTLPHRQLSLRPDQLAPEILRLAQAEAVAGDLKKIEDAALHAREIVRQLMLFARRDPPLTQPTEWEAVVTAALASRSEDVVDLVHEIASRESALLGCACVPDR